MEILPNKPGGSTPHQYAFPSDAKSILDLIRFRGMTMYIGGIFVYCTRLSEISHDDTKCLIFRHIIHSCESELTSPSTHPSAPYAKIDIPEGCVELQDLIEHYDMNFSVGNIFKACYRIGHCDHSSKERDLNKCIWFATRELKRYESRIRQSVS